MNIDYEYEPDDDDDCGGGGGFVSFHSQRGSPSLASVFCQDNIWYVTPAVFDSTYLCKYGTKPAATAPKSLVKHGSIETNRRRYEREIQKRVEQKSRRSHDV